MKREQAITRVGITGAAGHIGRTLLGGLPRKFALTLFDIREIAGGGRNSSRSRVVDLSRAEETEGIFTGLDAVIHLAADARPTAPWESIHRNNVTATYNVFEEARRAGVRRIVFASTNHVQHGYTMGPAADTLDESLWKGRGRHITLADPPAPDSLYAVSKLWGEDLGRYYARRFGIEVVALRIGWTVRQDDPRIKKGTPSETYMRAMFLSRRDCIAAFTRSLEREMKAGGFLLAYAVSRNSRGVFDLDETRRELGFEPRDNAEDYFSS